MWIPNPLGSGCIRTPADQLPGCSLPPGFGPPTIMVCCLPGEDPNFATGECCPVGEIAYGLNCRSRARVPKPRPGQPVQRRATPTACAQGYTLMPGGSCCANELVSADGQSCNPQCRRGEIRLEGGQCCNPDNVRGGKCEPPTRTPNCQPGQIMRDGRCMPSALPSNCRPGEIMRDGRCVPSALPSSCQPGQTLRDGRCMPSALPSNCRSGETLRDGRCVAGSDNPPTIKHPTTCGSGETLRDGKCTLERRPVLKPTPNWGRRWSNIPRATRSPPSFRGSFRGGGYRGGGGGHGGGGHGGRASQR
jgi:hypothetical protein